MRQKLVAADLVECVLGLGPNLFYNSPMEACVVVCRSRKPAERQGRILFVDAVTEVARERAQSFLKPEHQQRVLDAYHAFADDPGFARGDGGADRRPAVQPVDPALRQAHTRRQRTERRRACQPARALGGMGSRAGGRSGRRWMSWW